MSATTLPPPDVPHEVAPTVRAGRPVRNAWLIVGSLVILAALVTGTVQVVDLLAHEERTEVVTIDQPVAIVDVTNERGSVTVVSRTDGGGDVTITSEISEGLGGTDTRQAFADGRLTLRGGCRWFGGQWCSVDYLIEVPRGTIVRVRADDGRIQIDGPVGDLDVASSDGSVVVDGAISRDVVARSDDGRVRVRLAASPDAVTAKSSSGSVEVIVPDTPGAFRVDATTNDGSAAVEVRTDPTGPRLIEARSDDGDVTVRYGS